MMQHISFILKILHVKYQIKNKIIWDIAYIYRLKSAFINYRIHSIS